MLRLRVRSLTADFLRAAAGVIGQTDDHLTSTTAHRHRHVGAVVLHRDNGVIVAAVHAAGILRGLPHLAVCTRNAGAVSAGYGQVLNLKHQSNDDHLTSPRRLQVSYRTSQVRCRGRSTAGGGASPQGKCTPLLGLNTGRGLSQSRGWGRTGQCSLGDRPGTAEFRDTRRLQDKTQGICESGMELQF